MKNLSCGVVVSVGLFVGVVACGKPTNEEALGAMAQGLCERAATCANGKLSETCPANVKGDLQTAFGVSSSQEDRSSPCTDSELDECKTAIGAMSCDLFVSEESDEAGKAKFKISLSKLPEPCKCK